MSSRLHGEVAYIKDDIVRHNTKVLIKNLAKKYSILTEVRANWGYPIIFGFYIKKPVRYKIFLFSIAWTSRSSYYKLPLRLTGRAARSIEKLLGALVLERLERVDVDRRLQVICHRIKFLPPEQRDE